MLNAGETIALNSHEYDDQPYEIQGGSNVEDSGISEYLEFKQEVENKLRCAQAELVSNRRKLVACDETLLDRYDKLFNLVVDRPERDKARVQKNEADKVAKARVQEIDYKKKLLEEITSLSEERQHSELAVDASQIFLADFLKHNACILNSVVKAEAQDTERRRKAHRKQAHDLIIEGLQGTTSSDSAPSASAAMEQQMSLETSRSQQLRSELAKLRDHEELTDALVDQLRIKVRAAHSSGCGSLTASCCRWNQLIFWRRVRLDPLHPPLTAKAASKWFWSAGSFNHKPSDSAAKAWSEDTRAW